MSRTGAGQRASHQKTADSRYEGTGQVRAIAITGAVMSMALMTGCNGVERLAGNAAPVGVSPAASATASPAGSLPAPAPSRTTTPASAPTTTSRSPTTAPTTPPASSEPVRTPSPPRVLGPLGFGALRRGMTFEQARATGLIEGYEVEDFGVNCGMSKLKGTGATVFFTPGIGLSSIDMYGSVPTPQGIKLGSTMSAVQDAYPDWEVVVGEGEDGRGFADVPGNSKGTYHIEVSKAKVTYLALTYEGQRCIE